MVVVAVVLTSALLAYMPHLPAPAVRLSAIQSQTLLEPCRRSTITPRCPDVKAVEQERLLAIAFFLGTFGVAPFLLGVGGPKQVAATSAFDTNFLAENKLKEGVVTLPSGLQYKVLRAGDGDAHPLPNSPCECHYEGRCAKDWPSGKKFDSSYDRGSPTAFAPNQVISGWTEAMQLMVEGDKWEMYIPSNLAYGDSGRVPGCLVFTMEIIKIKGI